MPETNLNIIIQLYDKATEGVNKISDNLENFSRSIKQVGKEVSQVGSTLAITGAAITGPFVLAFNNASKSVDSVKRSLVAFENVIDNFQETIAKNMIPVVEHVTDILARIFNAFNSLSPAMQANIIQGALYSGIFLSLGGILLTVTGKVITLAGNLGLLISQFAKFAVANPILLITVGVIMAIVAAMIKWKAVADVVMSTLEVLFAFFKNGLLSIKIVLEESLTIFFNQLTIIFDLLGKLPGPLRNTFQELETYTRNISQSIQGSVQADLQGIAQNANTVTKIFSTGTGQWAQGFDNLKTSIRGAWDELTKGGTVAATSAALFKKNWEVMKVAVNELGSALMGYASINKDFALAAQITAIGMATMNMHEGITKAWGQGGIWGAIGAALVAAACSIEIAAIASQKFAEGTDSVPAMVTPGEMIFPRTMSDAIRSGDIVVSGRGGFNNQDNPAPAPFTINLTAIINNKLDIAQVAEELGFEIDRRRRYAWRF